MVVLQSSIATKPRRSKQRFYNSCITVPESGFLNPDTGKFFGPELGEFASDIIPLVQLVYQAQIVPPPREAHIINERIICSNGNESTNNGLDRARRA
jgi:hypothetical protein